MTDAQQAVEERVAEETARLIRNAEESIAAWEKWTIEFAGDFGEWSRDAQQKKALLVALSAAQQEAARLREALELLVADVKGYEAWQRPCHALDNAKRALTTPKGGT